MINRRPKYLREINLLELAIAMATCPQGITLEEIEKEFVVSHRMNESLKQEYLTHIKQIQNLY